MLKTLTTYSFFIMLLAGLVLPSDGDHGLLAPKTLAFLNGALFFFIYAFSRFKLNIKQATVVLVAMSFACFLGIWFIVGIGQDPLVPSGQFDQFKVFMTTLFIPVCGWYLIQDNLITPAQILRTAIYGQCAYCSVKVALMGLHLLKVINVWTVMHYTGLRFMSMQIVGEVGRIQTSVDILTPFLIFFVLQEKNLGLNLNKNFCRYFILISILSTFLSFSRYLIAIYAIGVVLHGMTLTLTKQIKFWLGCFLILFVGVMAAGPEKVWKAVEMRLFSDNNYQSDYERRVQIEALNSQCERFPFFGTGLGGYTKECIRDHGLPHAYEVQWVAFLMQFGLFGIAFILAPLVWIGLRLIRPPLTRVSLSYFSLYVFWLLSGFTNPFLISLTSGIVYLIFLIVPCQIALQRARVAGIGSFAQPSEAAANNLCRTSLSCHSNKG